MKGECIICRKNGVELSDEHIIPDALGGVLHSYRVCTNCNSTLGQYVDPLLLGHIYVKFERFLKKFLEKAEQSLIHLTELMKMIMDGNIDWKIMMAE